MNKQRFFTRLGQWPKIQFVEVCITAGDKSGSDRAELYVRDRADPPCWLFVRRLSASENRESVLASYSLWLTEYHRQRGTDYCLLLSPELPTRNALPADWQNVPAKPDARQALANER